MVEIIPVIDIRGGLAVSGRSGDREKYSPLKSVFSDDPDPLKIASSLPFERLYVADLDGIMEGRPDFETLKRLSILKKTLIDIGVREIEDLKLFDEIDCEVILGSETVKSMGLILESMKRLGERMIFSIDIKGNRVLSNFLPENPADAYMELVSIGVKRIIFLNISAVGTEKADFSFIKDLNMSVEILVGGGITEKDLKYMADRRIDGALVGTILHKGLLDVKIWV